MIVRPMARKNKSLLAGAAPHLWFGRILIGSDHVEAKTSLALCGDVAADKRNADVAVGPALHSSRVVAHAA